MRQQHVQLLLAPQNLLFKVNLCQGRATHTSPSSHAGEAPGKLHRRPSTDTKKQSLPGFSCLCLFQLMTNIEQTYGLNSGTGNVLCCSPVCSDTCQGPQPGPLSSALPCSLAVMRAAWGPATLMANFQQCPCSLPGSPVTVFPGV